MNNLGCLGFIVVGIALVVIPLQCKFQERAVRHTAFLAAAEQVAAGLEQSAQANGGLFPKLADVKDAVRPFLPGGAWPQNPWPQDRPGRAIAVIAPDPQMAYRDGAGEHLLAAALTTGQVPILAKRDHQSLYGATAPMGTLVYVTDATRKTYALFGIGGYALSDSPDGGVERPALRFARSNRKPVDAAPTP